MFRSPILALCSLAMALLPGPVRCFAQCCFGAQDVKATSVGRRFQVQAHSLTGIGIDHHGPYSYRFTTFELGPDGRYAPCAAFDRSFDTKTHFAMRLFVSPTGSGFLLATSLESGLLYFGRDGRVLRMIEPPAAPGLRVTPMGSDGLFLRVESVEDVGRLRMTTLRTRVFVPLGAVVGPRFRREGQNWVKDDAASGPLTIDREGENWLRRMLDWTPERGKRESAEVLKAIERLDAGPDEARRAADALVYLGLSALAPVKVLCESGEGVVALRARDVRRRIDALSGGHEAPQEDRLLLRVLVAHPNAELAATAESRLRALGER